MANPRPIDAAEEKRMVACYKAGMSIADVAARFRRDAKRVRDILIKNGITIEHGSSRSRWA